QDAETALRLAGALGTFWYLRGYLGEARKWLQEVLDRSPTLAPTAQRAKALNEAGRIALNQAEYVSARTYCEQAATLSHELNDKCGIFAALTNLANVADRQGDYRAARSLLEEGLVIGRELGDQHGIAGLFNDLGTVAFRWDDYAAAHTLYEESLEI